MTPEGRRQSELGIEARRPQGFNGFEKPGSKEEDAYSNLMDCELGANLDSESSDQNDD